MTYEECIDFINKRPTGVKDVDLNTMRVFMNELRNPQDNLKFIHIAGTNGKGSVTLALASLLKNAGYKVGVNTSPYIIDFRERLQVNGCYITKEDFCKFIEYIKPVVTSMEKEGFIICSFAIITALGFLLFEYKSCDIVCLETGLGGLYDPTNIIKEPLCNIIMSISLDHIDLLGSDIKDIAYEKAGIIKKNVPVILYPVQCDEVYSVIKETAKLNNNEVILPSLYDLKINNKSELFINEFIYKGKSYVVKNLGNHIINNMLVVIETASILNSFGFVINYENIKSGIYDVNLYCRMELVHKEPLVMLDGSHNIGGIESLCSFIGKLNKYHKIAFCAFSNNKDIKSQILRLVKTFDKIYITAFSNPRCISKKKVIDLLSDLKLDLDFLEFIDIDFENILFNKNQNSITVFCGSLYFASEVRAYLVNNNYINE